MQCHVSWSVVMWQSCSGISLLGNAHLILHVLTLFYICLTRTWPPSDGPTPRAEPWSFCFLGNANGQHAPGLTDRVRTARYLNARGLQLFLVQHCL